MAAAGMKWASWLLRALLLLMIVQSAVGVTWGDFTRAECVAYHYRKWYSRLWDIQGDWTWACFHTPACVDGHYFSSPSVCVDKDIGGMWGEFYVYDRTCNDLRTAPSQQPAVINGPGIIDLDWVAPIDRSVHNTLSSSQLACS